MGAIAHRMAPSLCLLLLALSCHLSPSIAYLSPSISSTVTRHASSSSSQWWRRGLNTRKGSIGFATTAGVPIRLAPLPNCPTGARTGCFVIAPASPLKVSGIHIALQFNKKLIVIDRTDSNNTYLKLPNSTANAYGLELDIDTGAQRALDVRSNVFCSTGQIIPDGTLYSIGGASDADNADPILNGSASIRAYSACTTGRCNFRLIGSMSTKRWYPTAQKMPDGRVLIVGGANTFGNIAINDRTRNNPTYEYWPKKADEAANFYLPFLATDTMPYNLYPFVHLLPNGLLFMFAGQKYILFNATSQTSTSGPDLSVTRFVAGIGNLPIYRNYPAECTSVLFPLSPANNYTPEVMICGGNDNRATTQYRDTRGNRVGGTIPADDSCWRIKPLDTNPTWVQTPMCLANCIPFGGVVYKLARVMGDLVILADGNILLVNGAGTGFAGLNQGYALNPVLEPQLFFPSNYSWYEPRLSKSAIARMYHSSALLLPNGTVIITGSNPNEFLNLGGNYPTEFRIELWYPPYMFSATPKPVITSAPKSVTVNQLFSVKFTATGVSTLLPRQRFTIALYDPGFSTHNQRHGMRHVWLNITTVSAGKNSVYTAIARSPPNLNIVPVGFYWLTVADQGTPCVEAVPVNVTTPARTLVASV